MMRRLTENQLFHRALVCAQLDREALIDAYSGEGPVAEEARALICWIQTMKGRRFSSLLQKQEPALFSIFVFAEQYEESLADAQADPIERRQALSLAEKFRDVRFRYWGLSQFEQRMRDSVAVDILEVPNIIQGRGPSER